MKTYKSKTAKVLVISVFAMVVLSACGPKKDEVKFESHGSSCTSHNGAILNCGKQNTNWP